MAIGGSRSSTPVSAKWAPRSPGSKPVDPSEPSRSRLSWIAPTSSTRTDRLDPGREPRDVPVYGLTLWSRAYGAFELRRIAAQLTEIVTIDDVSDVALIKVRIIDHLG